MAAELMFSHVTGIAFVAPKGEKTGVTRGRVKKRGGIELKRKKGEKGDERKGVEEEETSYGSTAIFILFPFSFVIVYYILLWIFCCPVTHPFVSFIVIFSPSAPVIRNLNFLSS